MAMQIRMTMEVDLKTGIKETGQQNVADLNENYDFIIPMNLRDLQTGKKMDHGTDKWI